MSLRLNKKTKLRLEFSLVGIIVLVNLFIFWDCLRPIQPTKDYSKVVLDKKGAFLHAYLSNDDKWRLYTELDEITPALIKSLRVKEDRYFLYHFGVNPVAIGRAAFNNIVKGYRTSGASTITMQVARMLDPKPRTIASKLEEMLFALQLEWRYTKKEILQLYVNLLPYGGNIEGIKSASLLYLNKFPQQLSLDEIAMLSVIPNNPEKYKIGKDEDALIQRRNELLHYFQKRKTFKSSTIEDALEQPIRARRRPFDKKAPHFARLALSKTNAFNINTTLDAEIQSKVEEISLAYGKQLQYLNIHNISAVVVDNSTRNIIAYLGSQDFSNTKHNGQVDGTKALRSPGSALKPLIYALAFDKGLYTPKSIINDLPINYNGYEPENYDEAFNGKVTLEFALANSLNVPAVKLLHQLGVNSMANTLGNAGFQWIDKNQRNLGLSLALGGCGVNLQELTALYAAFANDGNWQALNILQSAIEKESYDVISSEASFMLYNILTQIKRPDLPNEFKNSKNLPKIAWKTGTSYGRRDAWSIGYNRNYAIGVWCGNFSGDGVPELSGAEIATPLMVSLFNAIDYDKQDKGFSKPKNVGVRYVCKESGKVPNSFCEHQTLDNYIVDISNHTKCEHMKKVWVDEDATISYCSYCLPKQEVQSRLFPNLSGDLISYYDKEGVAYQKIPPHNPNCSKQFEEFPPKITMPAENAVYYIDTNEQEQVRLKADVHNDVETIFWYVNGELIGNSKKDGVYFTELPKGKVTITCTDDKGRASKIEIEVKHL